MRRTRLLVVAAGLGVAASGASGQLVRGEVRVRGVPLPDAVVFLERVGDSVPAPAPGRGRLDQRDLAFVPRVLVVSPGSTVEFPNSDPVMHNVFHPGDSLAAFDLGTYSSSEAKEVRFTQPGLFVVLCHVHPEMVGWVAVVQPSCARRVPAASVTAVPPGQYRARLAPAGGGRP